MQYRENISSGFCSNSEADASEILENHEEFPKHLEEKFPQYYKHNAFFNIMLKYPITQ